MANNDNAMARFLFAILQQKCLKDIDWNEVARNPVLTQEITNGHAARMRFSRFRQQILGLAPQKRNRTASNTNKSRVTKRKKEDGPKPKKEDEDEMKSGSGFGNMKRESIAAMIKSERKSISQHSSQPSQPPAPMMATPLTMKTEPGLANPYHQHLRHGSVLATSSPSIKRERVPSGSASIPATVAPMPEPNPFGIIMTPPTSSSPSSAAASYIDSSNHHHMQIRLPTPCSDSDGLSGIQGFLPHSPCMSTTDLLHHSQHHNSQPHHHNQHHHQQVLIGAGSPPLSISSPSPYDFSQHHQSCCDVTTLTDSSSPWHSQHHAQHHSQHLSQSQNPVYAHPPAFGLGISTGTAGGGFLHHHHPQHNIDGLDGAYHSTTCRSNDTTTSNNETANNSSNNPFCTDHHHHLHHHHNLLQHHTYHQQHHDEDAHHDMLDPLGLQHHHHHELAAVTSTTTAAVAPTMTTTAAAATGSSSGVAVTGDGNTSTAAALGVHVKGEWDAEGFEL